MPWAGQAELRTLDFYRRVVAPTLAGPCPSFWTDFVVQVAHREAVVRHAALAVGSFFEYAGGATSLAPKSEDLKFALHHYHKTIQQLIQTQITDLDTVVTTCIFLVCIEFLRGLPEAGMFHYLHGRKLLESYKSSPRLKTIFSYLNYFLLVFPDVLPDVLPPITSTFPSPLGPFEGLNDAKEALEGLTCRSLNLVWARENLQVDNAPGSSFVQTEQEQLISDIDVWSDALLSIQMKSLSKSVVTARRLLEARSLVCKIWATDGMRQEATYNQHEAIFNRIIELGMIIYTSDTRQFVFTMGFGPILHFVITRCRDMQMRLAAFQLFRAGCCKSPERLKSQLLCQSMDGTIEAGKAGTQGISVGNN